MELSGDERAIWNIVSQYAKAEPISRGELVYNVKRLGFDLPERTVREIIKQLRRKEYLICSVAGLNGGYYVAASLADFEEFDRAEFSAKIADMAETRAAMKRAAIRQFGVTYQASIFGGGF